MHPIPVEQAAGATNAAGLDRTGRADRIKELAKPIAINDRIRFNVVAPM
jgi:hypothetical protein